MANEQIIEEQVPVSETVEQTENPTPEVETAATDESTQEIDNSLPVTNSTEAHEVLKAQKELSAKEKTKDKKKSDNTEPEFVPRKQYLEIQKLANKHDRELSELRKHKQETEAMMKDWKANKEKQDLLEFQNMARQNPQEYYKELARREAQALTAPLQNQLVEVQAVNVNNQLQRELGDKYADYIPVFNELLDNFAEIDAFNAKNGKPTRLAEDFAVDAKSLIALANKEFEKQNTNKAIDISGQRRAENLRAASGVAKKTNIKSETPTHLKNLSLTEMTQQMKRMGILPK